MGSARLDQDFSVIITVPVDDKLSVNGFNDGEIVDFGDHAMPFTG
jgi:hypothetical protein